MLRHCYTTTRRLWIWPLQLQRAETQRLPRLINYRKANYSANFRPNTSVATRPATWKLLCMATIPLATFGLGTWQVQRLRWKVALIHDLEERSKLPAVILPKIIR
jgi:surfeit locus 1 family protein